jgi:hypothetical protein
MTPEIPHLALPLRFAGKRAVVVEQDSYEEIAMCVEAAARTTLGEQADMPEFGISHELFGIADVDLAELRAELAASEPRAATIVERITELGDVNTQTIRILLDEEGS